MYFKNLSTNKHFQKTVLLIIACFVCVGVFVGIGAAEEYNINSLQDLKDFRDAVNNGNTFENYIVYLTNDIDLSNESNWIAIGNNSNEEDNIFHGTFDGQGHVISNLTIYDEFHDNVKLPKYCKNCDHGLFGGTKEATIKNLILKNVNAYTDGSEDSGYITIGSLIGIMKSGSVSNCSISGVVSARHYVSYVGGLIGRTVGNCRVDNCSVSLEGDVKSGGNDDYGAYLGGLIGNCDDNNASCSVNNCFVIGNGYSVSATDSRVSYIDYVGGLIGRSRGDVSNCFVLLDNGGVNDGYKYVGGLIGGQEGNVSNCSFSGSVSGRDGIEFAGGLIGHIGYGYKVQNCSISLEGDVMSSGTNWASSYLGGLIGFVEATTRVENCFIIGNGHSVSGALETDKIGGLIGLSKGDVSNCFVLLGDGTVTGGGGVILPVSVGGLIGYMMMGNVSNCFVSGVVSAGGDGWTYDYTGGLIGSMDCESVVNYCYTTQNVSCDMGHSPVGIEGSLDTGGLVGYIYTDDCHLNHCVALNQFVKQESDDNVGRVTGGKSADADVSQNYGWNEMMVNDHTLKEKEDNWQHGKDTTSKDVWKNLTFWQSVFGSDNISDDGSKTWNLIKSEDDSLWCLPYLTTLGKPSDKDAEKIQYLIPSVISPTNITYNDGQYTNKQALSQNKLPRITLYKDVFDITKEEGSNHSFSLDTSEPWQNYYLWQNNSQPITFSDAITNNVSWNDLESIAAMENQNITFALGDENQTSISGTERNVSITVENYLQLYTNNSMDKTRTSDGWFFDTPYTVSLAVRPGPEAYHASEQNGTLWNSHVLIQNLTNNVSKQDSVAWRFATDTKNTTYNNYTVDNQNYLNSTEYLQVKSAESADGDTVNITLTGYKLGDVNRNDVVNINDVSAMIKLILAASKDNYTYEAALKAFPNTRIEHLIYADDNKKGGDGQIDVSDLLVINEWLVKGSVNFNYDGWE